MKQCTKCLLTKPIDEFWKDNRGYGDGHNSRCKTCHRDYARRYRQGRPNIERQRYQSDKEGAWERHLRNTFGIDAKIYNAIFDMQSGRCAICNSLPNKQHLSVDHDHATGQIRGLLCQSCNRMLGYGQDNSAILQAGVNYLTTPLLAATFIRSVMEALDETTQ